MSARRSISRLYTRLWGMGYRVDTATWQASCASVFTRNNRTKHGNILENNNSSCQRNKQQAKAKPGLSNAYRTELKQSSPTYLPTQHHTADKRPPSRVLKEPQAKNPTNRNQYHRKASTNERKRHKGVICYVHASNRIRTSSPRNPVTVTWRKERKWHGHGHGHGVNKGKANIYCCR